MNHLGADQSQAETNVKLDTQERTLALRRFNLFFVYLPVALVALVTLLLLVWLTINGLNTDGSEARENYSAIADIALVIFLTPFAILCGILPILLLYLGVQLRRRKISITGSTRSAARRLDGLLNTIDSKISRVGRASIQPLIALHMITAFLKTFKLAIIRIFKWR